MRAGDSHRFNVDVASEGPAIADAVADSVADRSIDLSVFSPGRARGNWFSDIAEAFAALAGQVMDMVVDAFEWLNEHFIVTVDPNGGVTIRNR